MERFYKCNKCGSNITKLKDGEKSPVCTSPALMPVRRVCGGSFTIELSEQEVIEQLVKWNVNDDEIKEFVR